MMEESINHRRYLHGQESEVSKLLVEPANLLLVQPGLVLHARLETQIHLEEVGPFLFLK